MNILFIGGGNMAAAIIGGLVGRLGLLQRDLGQVLRDLVAQHLVLRHREAVPIGQGQDEMVGVEGLHGNDCAACASVLRGGPVGCSRFVLGTYS